MRSVADDLRKKDREEILKLSAEERLHRAFALGEIALEAFRQAQGIDRETAIRLLQRRRQASRRYSKCMMDLIG